MPLIESLNIGAARPLEAKSGKSAIDKRPVGGLVLVSAPGPKGQAGSGLSGDEICDTEHHGGDDQAVYAYAREDLDNWQSELAMPLRSGMFGENLTTRDLNITDALIGEQWQIGEELVLQVTSPRVPCRTFAAWLGMRGWVKTFTLRAIPGAYLRVLRPGYIRSGDSVQIVQRPAHDVTIGLAFRALTTERDLLPQLLVAHDLPEDVMSLVRRRLTIQLDDA